MYCKNCGKELNDSSTVCKQCGASVNDEKKIKLALLSDIEKAKNGAKQVKTMGTIIGLILLFVIGSYLSPFIETSEYDDGWGWVIALGIILGLPVFIALLIIFLNDLINTRKKYAPRLENIKKQYLNDNTSADIKNIISSEEEKMKQFYSVSKILILLTALLLIAIVGVVLYFYIRIKQLLFSYIV